MKNRPIILIILLLVLLSTHFAACKKDELKIGRDNPQFEIQKCMRLSEKKKFEEAIECLEIFKSRFPQTTLGTQAELSIADAYFNKKEYLLAADAYLIYVRMHPTSPQSDYAYYRLGLSYLKQTPEAIDRDQQYIDKAIHYLRLTATAFPSSPYHEAAVESLKDARSRVARRVFYIGRFYYRTGQYKAAIPRFLTVVNDYSETDLVPPALYKLVVSTGKLQKVNDSKLFFSKLTLDYPDSKWTKKAEGKVRKYVKKYGAGDGESMIKEAPQPTGGANDAGRE